MKAALMNQNALPYVAPPGPLASAPVASAANQNMWYMSTDFGLCQCVKGFLNAGTDYVNCGKPTWLSRLTPKTSLFTINAVARQTVGGFQSIVGLSDTDPPVSPAKTQFMLGLKTGGSFEAYVGGSSLGGTIGLIPTGSLNRLTLAIDLTKEYVYKNGVLDVSTTIGTRLANGDLFIGALANGFNFEGFITLVEFYAGANLGGSINGLELLDRYDFNRWDGTADGYSEKGFPYVMTKGSPLTEVAFEWVPRSYLT